MAKSKSIVANLIGLFVVVSIGLNVTRWLTGRDDPGLLLAFLGVVGLVIYGGAPILIHQTQWVAAELNLQPFDPASPDAPAEARAEATRINRELDRLGFRLVRSYQTSTSAPNTISFVALFANPQTSEWGKLIVTISTQGEIRNVLKVVSFGSDFADGTEVVTSNRSYPRIYPLQPPPYHGAAFPQIQQMEHLLRVHRALVDPHESGRIRVNPVAADPDRFLRERDYVRPMTHAVACGYQYLDDLTDRYRPTWKGAYLMTWKLMPPLKQIRLAADRRQAARTLRALALVPEEEEVVELV